MPDSSTQSDDDVALRAAMAQQDDLAGAIDQAMQDYRDSVDTEALRVALAAGGTAAVVAAALLSNLDKDLDAATTQLKAIFQDAAEAEARAMANMIAAESTTQAAQVVTTTMPGTSRIVTNTGRTIILPYDPSATAGVTDLEMMRANLLAEIRAATEDGINAAVQAGFEAHLDLDQIIAALKDTIGLTPRQAQAVLNFRTALEDGDASLDRALAGNAWMLRDHRFDATMARIADGEFVADSKIDAMVDAYARRQLTYRAQMIARTEGMTVANAGVRSNYSMAISRGVFPKSDVRRFWMVSGLENTCMLCLSVPLMNPLGVGFDEPFLSIEGPLMMPVEDTHPACMCSVSHQIVRQALTFFAQQAAE